MGIAAQETVLTHPMDLQVMDTEEFRVQISTSREIMEQ
jgi:hypothetical protein